MIYLGSDHAGYELKEKLKIELKKNAFDFEDLGCFSRESCDYPEPAERVGRAIQKDPASLGVLVCGSGIGVSIAANKITGVRAAHVADPESAKLARLHNHAQIICLGARTLSEPVIIESVFNFLRQEPDPDERHQRRIDKIHQIEKDS